MLNIETTSKKKRAPSNWTLNPADVFNMTSKDTIKTLWKPLPEDLLANYEVSNDGRVRHIDPRTKSVTYCKPYMHNGYDIVSLVRTGETVSEKFKVHRLVALMFVPLPAEGMFKKLTNVPKDGVPYVVNHKNSIRMDNVWTNLEWCDDGHNLKHSLSNNRHTYSLAMTILDLKTNKRHEFTHMREVSEFFGTGPESLIHRLALAIKTPYLKRYSVQKVNLEGLKNDGSTLNSSFDNVVIYNAIDAVVSIEVSRRAAAVETGIAMRTIRDIIERYKRDGTDTKIGGFMFRPLSSDAPWPKYNKSQACVDRMRYIEQTMNGVSNSSISIEVLDYVTGEKSSFDSVKEAADHYGYSSVTLNKYVRIPNAKTKELRLYDGKVFKSSDNLGNWPDYSKEQAIASKAATARNNTYGVRKEFLVVNESSGESVTKPNLRAVADYLGINRSTMSSWFNSNPDRSFNGHRVSVK